MSVKIVVDRDFLQAKGERVDSMFVPSFISDIEDLGKKIKYYMLGPSFGFYFTKDMIILTFLEQRFPEKNYLSEDESIQILALALQFLQASPKVEIEGQDKEADSFSFFMDNDTNQWQDGFHSYRKVVYLGLWEGINLVFRLENNQLKYEFVLQPGANIANIRLTYQGVDGLALDKEGNLLITTSVGILADERPKSYQEIEGRQVEVASGFSLEKEKNIWGFTVSQEYRPEYPLIIDPALSVIKYFRGKSTII